MKIFLDCLPCMLRQVLDAARLATDKTAQHEAIMDLAVQVVTEYRSFTCAPALCRKLHQLVKSETGIKDPYAGIKARDIAAAHAIYPMLLDFLEEKQGSLEWALKIAATGNSLDSAINLSSSVTQCVSEELHKGFAICDIEAFMRQMHRGKTLLIIGDNAGETVFDKVLLQSLAELEITYAVRSGPIINDATLDDAIDSGLDAYARIISTGCDAPGAVLEECGAEFRQLFTASDLVLSKGQGNFEALSEQPREIFFLLKAKCPMIARQLGVQLNQYVFSCNHRVN